MADKDQKTEKPTPRRMSKARSEGNVPKSTDFNTAIVLGGVTLILMWYGTHFMQYTSRLMRELLWHQLRMADTLTLASFIQLLQNFLYHIILIIAPILIGITFVAIAANYFQIRFLFTTKPLHPNWGKLNPLGGLKRLLQKRSAVELIKSILKMLLIGACGFWVIHNHQDQLMAMSQMGFMTACTLVWKVMLEICTTIVMVLLVLGFADWKYQKKEWIDQLKMTKQEIKDEMKNTEGDPKIKSKIRSMGQSILRQQIAKAVPTADVVVTNPTHFAVAIQYDPDVAPAPRVVAKGADHMAFYIRELAKANNVVIVENKPLARTLYAMVEVGFMVPPELFIAVAEVLAFVFKRSKGRRRGSVQKMVGPVGGNR